MAILDTIKNQFNQNQASEEDESPRGKVIKKLCPNCHGSTLEFYETDTVATCYACDESISVAELLAAPASADGAVASAGAAVAVPVMVDSPESGLVYLENFFSNYDWNAYNRNAVILLSDINKMVEDNKIKQGASPASWLLDFLSVSIPMKMKLKGLEPQEAEVAAAYNGVDNTAALSIFDRYRNITNALLNQKDALIKRMENDITFAKRQGLDAEKVQEISAELEAIKAALAGLKRVNEITDLTAVAKKQEKINTDMIQSFKEKGIDVVAEYEKACKYYEQGGNDKRLALQIFESIRGFGKSLSYIQKINYYFNYHGEFFNFYGGYYVYKTHEGNKIALDPTDDGGKKGCLAKKGGNAAAAVAKSGKKGCLSKKGGEDGLSEEDAFSGNTLELYEVVNGEPADEPILKGITDIIKYYGSVLYYVKLDKIICAFDLATRVSTELMRVENAEDLKLSANNGKYYYFNKTSTAMYILKRLEFVTEKAGCKDILRGKKDMPIEHRNNYEVYELNFVKGTCERVINEIVDIVYSRDNFLFYTYADEIPAAQNDKDNRLPKPVPKLNVMVMNTDTHKSATLFKEDCKVVSLVGTRIIYTKRKPNRLNLDLHVFDMATKTDNLIENNIYSYLTNENGRVYYRVGNERFAPLFSNNFEGTDRLEVITHLSRVAMISAGWMYIIKGSGRNTALFKVSVDGKQRLFICSQFKETVKITDSHIYYITVDGDLRVVRSDGRENTFIAENINASKVQIDDNYIYYLRREPVSSIFKGNSLYRMDMSGHNIRKLLFNVVSMKNYDDNTLYVEKEDKIRFHIFVPAPRKKDEKEYDETFELTRYYKYDKATGEMDNILTVGMPHPEKYEAKGCLGKKKEMESIFTEIPIEDDFEEIGERAGATFNEQLGEQATPVDEGETSNGGCGKSGCANVNKNASNGGCLAALKKK